ncbi:MAG: hypothetical protein OES14_07565 [Nitrosopumilus sp.]|nr:hypothetical protein [Nitrosopumilus sp.]MDH3825633.1 hypothetical protein [Nitrosopumilus sp.]
MAMQEAKQRSLKNIGFGSSKNTISSTCVVECYVCGKGLQDGHSITAKTLPSGNVLFCNVHYPLQ